MKASVIQNRIVGILILKKNMFKLLSNGMNAFEK
jgi:hypothetical protein